jgi:hypothetical protein|tara:strand:+ start:164 stop:358 length:195 start_codon:yes stop_codon:yes gene_type:complete
MSKNAKTKTCAALPQISIFEKSKEDKLESRIFKLQNDFLYPPRPCAAVKTKKKENFGTPYPCCW